MRWFKRFRSESPPEAAAAPVVPDQATLVGLLARKASLAPDTPVLCADGSVPLTYQTWLSAAQALAEQLRQLPDAQTSVFALLFDGVDWNNYAIAYAAVGLVGGVVMHINGRMPEAEIVRRLELCGADWIIRSPRLRCPPGYETACLAGPEDIGAVIPRPRGPRPDYAGIAEIRFTSGTTGTAKGYLVPHANLMFNQTLDTVATLAQSRTILAPITMADSSSATLLAIAITGSSRLVVTLPYDVERMGELIAQEAIESFMLTPLIIRNLIDSGLEQRHDLTSVRLLAFSSAPASAASTRALRRMFPNAVVQIACAQSEASPALLTGVHSQDRPFGIGRPTPLTEARVVTRSGQEADVGEVGELWLRTSAAKRLFLDTPAKNAQIKADGWYRTGDLVTRDADGAFEFFDREVDALAREGGLVSSVHLEGRLAEFEAVKEVAIVEARRGEDLDIVVFVVPRWPLSKKEFEDAFENLIEGKIHLDRIFIVDELPRTQTGKILKRSLRIISSI